MKLKESKILLLWGLTTFTGWFLTGLGYIVPFRPFTVLAAWTVLMAVPVALTVVKFYQDTSNKLFNFWALAVAVLMVENFFINRFLIFSYFTLWLIVGAAGYYYTSRKIPPPSEKTYFYGTGLNILAVPLVHLLPLRLVAFVIAFVQTGPIFYDYWKVHM